MVMAAPAINARICSNLSIFYILHDLVILIAKALLKHFLFSACCFKCFKLKRKQAFKLLGNEAVTLIIII